MKAQKVYEVDRRTKHIRPNSLIVGMKCDYKGRYRHIIHVIPDETGMIAGGGQPIGKKRADHQRPRDRKRRARWLVCFDDGSTVTLSNRESLKVIVLA